MLSRVADSLYWLGRYVERAENVARFVDVNLHRLLDLPVDADDGEQWEPLVAAAGDLALFRERCGDATREHVIEFLTFDEQNPNSIVSCVRAARENARSVRETVSSEMWEQVNTFYLRVTEAVFAHSHDRKARFAENPHDFFTVVKTASHLFVGVMNATMAHGEGWHFCRLGRLMELADQTTRFLDVKYFILLPDHAEVGTSYDDLEWAAVLRSASAFEMYRKRHGLLLPERIADFLLLERAFPRSVRFCVVNAQGSLHEITGTPLGEFRTEAERRLGQLRAELDFASTPEIILSGLHQYLDGMQQKLNRIDEAIYETCFALQQSGESATDGREPQ